MNVMIKALTNAERYSNPGGSTKYTNAIRSLPSPHLLEEFNEYNLLQRKLEHKTFLEELFFWTLVYEFPEKLVTLFMKMLLNKDYKLALSDTFIKHYTRMCMMFEKSENPEKLGKKVVQLNVQLFGHKELAEKMAEDSKILHVMVVIMKYMMSQYTVANEPYFVVDCDRHVVKNTCYWVLASDLNQVLRHKPVARCFMTDKQLLRKWFAILSLLQGMNMNERIFDEHVVFEPETYEAAFTAEGNVSASPMWALASHLEEPENVRITQDVLRVCLGALRDWFQVI